MDVVIVILIGREARGCAIETNHSRGNGHEQAGQNFSHEDAPFEQNGVHFWAVQSDFHPSYALPDG
jgi:hypothetical protein